MEWKLRKVTMREGGWGGLELNVRQNRSETVHPGLSWNKEKSPFSRGASAATPRAASSLQLLPKTTRCGKTTPESQCAHCEGGS